MHRSHALTMALVVGLLGCSSTLDGSRGRGPDAAVVTDVPPGVNPDGQDPFRPTDSGVIFVDGSVFNNDAWSVTDAPVLDERYGYVYVGSYFAGGAESTYVQAEFRYHARPEDPRCNNHGAGSWDVSVCDDAMSPVMDTHPRPFPNAGEVTVRGGSEVVTLAPQPSTGQYTYFFQSRVVFEGPRTIAITAAGSAMVPAFAQTLTVPPRLNVTAPADLADGGTVIDRTRDMVITWEPNATRSVQVSLTAVSTADPPRTVRLYQEFYGSAGRGVIPAAALRDFMAVSAGQTATLIIMPVTITTLRSAGWPIQYSVVGRGVVGQVTLR